LANFFIAFSLVSRPWFSSAVTQKLRVSSFRPKSWASGRHRCRAPTRRTSLNRLAPPK